MCLLLFLVVQKLPANKLYLQICVSRRSPLFVAGLCTEWCTQIAPVRTRPCDPRIISPKVSILLRPLLSKNPAYLSRKVNFVPYEFLVAYSCVLLGL